MIQIEVPLGERSYPVLVGPAALGELSSLVPDDVRRVAFVTQENIGISTEIHLPTSTHYLPHGEEAKQLSVIESLSVTQTRWRHCRSATRAPVRANLLRIIY